MDSKIRNEILYVHLSSQRNTNKANIYTKQWYQGKKTQVKRPKTLLTTYNIDFSSIRSLLFCSFVDICTCYIVYAPFASSTGQWFTRTAKNFEGKIAPHSSLLERRPNVVRKRHTTAVEKFNRIRASDHLTN